jgi:hypothetical protein
LIINWKDYYYHILENQGRDFFLIVDEKKYNKTTHILKLLDNIANDFFVEFDKINLKEIIEKNNKIYEQYYNDKFYQFIEWVRTEINIVIQKRFETLIDRVIHHILKREKSYWENTEKYIFEKCKEINIDKVFH